jgi:hypothetical protein
MSNISELRRLKDEYERLRDQYLMTRQLRHYTRFQEAFRAYMLYIDTHRISARSITDSLHIEEILDKEETPFEKKTPLAAPKKSSSRKLNSQRISPHDVNKRILDFFETNPDYHMFVDLMSHTSLKETQIRKALPLLVRDRLLEKTKIQGTFYWYKAGQKPDNLEILDNKPSDTEEMLLRILNQRTEVLTTDQICASTPFSSAHVGRSLNKLFEKDRIDKVILNHRVFWRQKEGI